MWLSIEKNILQSQDGETGSLINDVFNGNLFAEVGLDVLIENSQNSIGIKRKK